MIKVECGSCGKRFDRRDLKSERDENRVCLTCRNKLIKSGKTHGLSKSPLYLVYFGILSRCNNPSNPRYHRYGGRGITICDEWRNDFATFDIWAKNNGYKSGLQIDRIDNNKGYFKENCRWVSSKVNNNNKADNIESRLSSEEIKDILTSYQAKSKSVVELSKFYKIARSTIYKILKENSIEVAYSRKAYKTLER